SLFFCLSIFALFPLLLSFPTRRSSDLFLVGAIILMAMYSPLLTLAFLATTPIYVGLMIFSVKVLRPLYHGVEESQGKYSSHQIDAIKGIEAVKAASAANTFRDAMLNEFLSVSQKLFK